MRDEEEQPFPVEFNLDWLDLDDETLGKLLLGLWIAVHARDAGFPLDNIPCDFAERQRLGALSIKESPTGEFLLEKALLLVANYEPERGGKFFREYMKKNALDEALMTKAIKGVKFSPGRKAGSQSEKVKYIHELVGKNMHLSSKQLMKIADKSIIGNMTRGTFSNHVTQAKKRFT